MSHDWELPLTYLLDRRAFVAASAAIAVGAHARPAPDGAPDGAPDDDWALSLIHI